MVYDPPMAHEKPIRIPLPEKKALELLLKIKPTSDMPGKRRKKAAKKGQRTKA